MIDENYFRKIKRNSVRCLICFDEIESKHRHDHVTCGCGNVSIDGGTDYARRTANDFTMVEDTTVWRNSTVYELEYEISMCRNRPYYSAQYNRRVGVVAKELLKLWYGV